MGVMLDSETMTEEDLTSAINEVLSNSTYTRNAKVTQALFNDHLVEPKKEFLYWIKYIIRHKGAKHLINHNVHEMSLIEFWSLDVYLVLVVLLFLVIAFSVRVLYFVIKSVTNVVPQKKKKGKVD